MDEEAVDRMLEKITEAIDGEDYESVMIVIGCMHNSLAIKETLDETRLRALYQMMGDAAVCLAAFENESDSEFQAEENSTQNTQRKTARKASGNESDPSSVH